MHTNTQQTAVEESEVIESVHELIEQLEYEKVLTVLDAAICRTQSPQYRSIINEVAVVLLEEIELMRYANQPQTAVSLCDALLNAPNKSRWLNRNIRDYIKSVRKVVLATS